MQVAFDPDKGVLEVRGDSPRDRWPFTLDCTLGAARIEMGGTTFEVRPLTWRQKRLLARYSGLGADFIQFQFLQLASGDRQVPAVAADRDVLLTVAMWMNAPGDGGATALNPGVLARVEMDVCRSLSLRPGDLDATEALHVEDAWRSLSRGAEIQPEGSPAMVPVAETSGARQPLPAGSDMHRIRIIPDPQPDSGAAMNHATPADVAESAERPAARKQTPTPETIRSEAATLDDTNDQHRESISDVPDISGPRPAPLLGDRTLRWSAPGKKHAGARSAAPPERTRLVHDSTAVSPRDPVMLSRAPGREVESVHLPATQPPVASQPVVMSAAVRDIEYAPAVVSAAVAQGYGENDIDVDALVDELSDRLERAAADLGIPVRG